MCLLKKLINHLRCLAQGEGKLAASKLNSTVSRGRTRAVDGEDKEARRQAILNAAELLYAQRHEFASVADIAENAGLAKGTVYLYFGTKEEIYLALHLRNMDGFFSLLMARLDNTDVPMPFNEMRELTLQHIIRPPHVLSLGASCIGFLPHTTSPDAAAQFQVRMTGWLMQAGEKLEQHFPRITPGYGPALLKHSYAIVLGLYSMRGPDGEPDPRCPDLPGMGDFGQEVLLMLTRYWAQVAGVEDDLSPQLPRMPVLQKTAPAPD